MKVKSKGEKMAKTIKKLAKNGIRTTGFTDGKSNRLGGGGQFKQVTNAIMKSKPKGGIKEAKAIAAIEGRKKFGKAKFAKMAANGRKRAAK